MRSLFLLILLIPIFAFAEIVTVRSGNFIEVMNLDKSNHVQARMYEKYEKNGQLWKGDVSKRLKMGLPVGAMSNSSMPVVLEHTVEKKAVSKSLFNKSKIIGKKVIDRAPIVGWVLLAAELMQSDLEDEGYSPRDELNGEYGRQPATTDYVIFVTSKNLGISTISGVQTNMSLKAYCDSKSVTCTNLGVVSQDSIQAKKDDYCKSVAPPTNSWGGELSSAKYGTATCEFKYKRPGGITDSESGTQSIIHARTGEYVALSENEFERIFMPQMEDAPSDYVNASRDEQNSAPPSFSYVGVTGTAGTSVKTDVYTDPRDGKAKETKITINADGKTATLEDTLRPDLQGDTELAPVPTPLPENETGSETKPETPTASIPVQCDIYPDSLGCEKMGDGSEAEAIFDDIKIPEITNPAEFKLDSFLPSTGTCPAPKTITLSMGTIVQSYEKHCEAAEMLRPFIIIISSLVGLYLIIRSKD